MNYLGVAFDDPRGKFSFLQWKTQESYKSIKIIPSLRFYIYHTQIKPDSNLTNLFLQTAGMTYSFLLLPILFAFSSQLSFTALSHSQQNHYSFAYSRFLASSHSKLRTSNTLQLLTMSEQYSPN